MLSKTTFLIVPNQVIILGSFDRYLGCCGHVRREARGTMRYFLYISDAKVDMLLPQVPETHQQKVAAKLGFDIKLLSGSIATERTTLDTRVARLGAVEAYIRDTEAIGTPAETARWIAADIEVQLAHIREGAIMFVAATQDWLLALGGSAHHLIGSMQQDDVHVGYSFLPTLIDLLKRMDTKAHQYVLTLPDDAVRGYWTAGLGQGIGAWGAIIEAACRQVVSPPQRVTFLAKRLLSEQVPYGRRVVLATPLYVALQD